MTYFIAQTSFDSWWSRFMLFYSSTWIIKQYGNGDFRVYEKTNILWLWPFVSEMASSAFSTLEGACAWCEKQIKDNKVKSVTYVLEDDE